MKFFDLHCDTAYEMYVQDQGFQKNKLNIDLERAEYLEEYRQVMALWCNNERTDEECFEDFLAMHRNFLHHSSVPADFGPFAFSLEDARLLCGSIERLKLLRDMGIRFLIPMWKGESIIGGAFDTDVGLTDFGREVIKGCFELGIIPDISHCSVKSADEILSMAEQRGKTVIASHSCSYSVYAHKRNLRDEQFERIKALGGVVGLSLCAYHLTEYANKCCADDIVRHFEHYLSLGGEDMTCFGADMDGAPMPVGITGIESIANIYEILCKSFGNCVSEKLAYKNASNFIKKNF